jgi:hypothetical protein
LAADPSSWAKAGMAPAKVVVIRRSIRP